ncbi:hypothetical protein [Mycoplasma seminis]|uniref:Uncharacterized protein n=1 Tax=Mycoplasma seminis TaxID=512749 RepID=A0ABY9HB12_9MOLU|nr:hypothetical protein [Mycoplasma seminis]WLP85661.1 hypothetical protein Q8852_00670 [Mycoplasma seminis]
MKINFKSTIQPVVFENGEEIINTEAIQVIEFDAPLTKNINTEEKSIELIFKEPKYNETNRVDIYENEFWVYTNSTTVQVIKNDYGKATVTFLNPENKQLMEFEIRTFGQEFIQEENKYTFKYYICAPDSNNPASYFDLQLTISE